MTSAADTAATESTASEPTTASGRLRVRTKLAYGTGAFGFSIVNSMFLFFYSYFLTDVALLAPILVTVIQVVRKGYDAINDPLIGMITDRTRTRWGRRRPFILFALIPFAFLFAMLWQPAPFIGTAARVGWYVLMILLFDTAATFVWVPYNALTPELTPDYDERTSLNGYRQAFSMVGGLVVGGLVEMLVAKFATPVAGFSAVGWGAGILAAVPFLWVVFGVREPMPPPKAKNEPTMKMMDMFRITMSNRAFLIALAIYVLSWIAVGVASTMFIYFLKHWMNMGGQVFIVLLTVQVSALASIPGIVWLSARFGKRETYIGGITFWAVAQLVMLFLHPEHAAWAIALSACAGVGVGAAHVLPWSMIPDCIEIDELQTGKRREGAYYGVWTFAEKAGVALALVIVGLVLQLYGYEGAAAEQTPIAKWAVRMLMGPGPAVLLILSIVAAYYYPITRKSHKELLAKLAVRRKEREQQA